MRSHARNDRWLFAQLYFVQRVWEPLGLARHRRAVARGARGRVLEIGVGSGFSLPHYEHAPLVACDPNVTMLRKARRKARQLSMPTLFVAAKGEALPFRHGAFDTVVTQVVLCTVDSPRRVAGEIHRVLSSDGHFRFVEHGLASRPGLAKIQRVLTPLWHRLFGGCRLDREIMEPLLSAGLEPEKVRHCSGGSVIRATLRPGGYGSADGLEVTGSSLEVAYGADRPAK